MTPALIAEPPAGLVDQDHIAIADPWLDHTGRPRDIIADITPAATSAAAPAGTRPHRDGLGPTGSLRTHHRTAEHCTERRDDDSCDGGRRTHTPMLLPRIGGDMAVPLSTADRCWGARPTMASLRFAYGTAAAHRRGR